MMAFWLAAILLVTYLAAVIIAGHGVAPLALLLVWGDPADFLPGQVLAWASIVGLVFATIWFRHDPLKLALHPVPIRPVSGGIRGGSWDTHQANRATA